MKCPVCGKENIDNNLYCYSCGSGLNDGDAFCSECGKKVEIFTLSPDKFRLNRPLVEAEVYALPDNKSDADTNNAVIQYPTRSNDTYIVDSNVSEYMNKTYRK